MNSKPVRPNISTIEGSGAFHKIGIVLRGILIFKDWHVWLGEHFGFRMKHGKFRLRDGTTFFVSPQEGDNIAAFQEIYIQKRYTKFYTPSGNDTVIDIGGAIGEFAVYCAKLSPQIRVYAYEPEPRVFARMEAAITENKLEDRVHGFHLAVASKPGDVTVVDTAGNLFWPDTSYTAHTTTLESIFTDNHIERCDLFKMDVEGAEFDILPHAPRPIFDKIKHIVMEYHREPEPLVELLSGHGFRVQVFSSSNNCGYLYADK